MRYHNWPPAGTGTASWNWDGDDSCPTGGTVGGGLLTVDLTDGYDWANMPDDCGGGCSAAEQAALAELCYEVAVAFEMDFGVCGSGTWTHYATWVLPTFFGYDPLIDRENRSDHTPATWWNLITTELDAGRPMLYRIRGHAIVCDGWREFGGNNQYHMNYGWADGHNTWYTLDNLYCPWAGCGLNEEYLVRNIMPLSTIQCDQPELSLLGYKEIDWTPPLWTVKVEVQNAGPGIARNVNVTMDNSIPWLIIPDPTCFYGDIAEGSTSWGEPDQYVFDLSGHPNPGGAFNIWFDVTYEDECGNQYTVRLDPEFNRDSEDATPALTYRLGQNYPNPFNPSTTISFQIPEAGHVDLRIYDGSGKLVRTLVDGWKDNGGLFAVTWDGLDNTGVSVASGIYFYKLMAGSFVDTKKMVLIR
jgi:hypothetical protein